MNHQIKKIKICTFNVENLFISDAKKPSHHLEKSQEKIRALADVIRDINADIYFLCEVGGEESLKAFALYYLKDTYQGSLIPGNTDRGIEIAYLIKKDSNFRFEHYTHRHREIDYLNKKEIEENKIRHEKNEELITSHKFSRDVAELRLFYKNDEKCEQEIPFLTLLGVHLKSKLDTDGQDFEGRGKREAEVKMLMKISKTMFSHWQKKCPLIILGDFNGPAIKESPDPEFTEIWENNTQLGLKDVLDILEVDLEDRTSFLSVPHPARNIPLRKQQLDYFLLTKELHSKIEPAESGIYHFKLEGNTLRYPVTLQEKLSLPADHYPIYATIRLS